MPYAYDNPTPTPRQFIVDLPLDPDEPVPYWPATGRPLALVRAGAR